MVLADLSLWVDHLRSKNVPLIHLLQQSQVAIYPMIISELACSY